jgi:UDP-glucose 4-epimerase
MSRVLVTGGTGFIGSAVVEALNREGYDVFRYDRSQGQDILNIGQLIDDFNLFVPDAVIHLAGVLGTHELFDSPALAIDINIHGSLNVMDQCAKRGIPYVGISMPDVFPSIYTATKVATMRLAQAYGHSMGLVYGHVVAYNAFGPGQAYGPGHPQKIVPTFAMACKRGEPMPVWGLGTQGVDLIHTDDLAACFVEMLRLLEGKDPTDDGPVIHGGNGIPFTVLEVAKIVAQAAGVEPIMRFLPMRRGEKPTHVHAPLVDHVRTRFRWDIEKQVAETVRWYLEQP